MEQGLTLFLMEAFMPDSGAAGNTLKLVGEAVLPGASNLADGEIKTGAGHALLGAVAGSLLGPLGLMVVKANSFSYSVSEKHLHQHAGEALSSATSSSSSSTSS